MNAAILRSLIRGMPRDGDHADRLDAFYVDQAAGYDRFRERLLHGRDRLLAALDLRPGHRLLDLGGGTGRNLEFLGDAIDACASVEVVDLCRPLLAVADRRVRTRGWNNVTLTRGDVCHDDPTILPVDRVIFSYALSMIPDWEVALDRALGFLRPGGRLGVVDFYVSQADPPAGHRRHGVWTRWFWPRWFRHDHVYLRPGLLPALLARLVPIHLEERSGSVPFLPGLRVPHLVFVGSPRLPAHSKKPSAGGR